MFLKADKLRVSSQVDYSPEECSSFTTTDPGSSFCGSINKEGGEEGELFNLQARFSKP